MKKKKALLVAVSAVVFLVACTKGRPSSKHPAPDGVPEFTLLDQDGVSHNLYRDSDARAVVIIGQGNDCPIIQKYSNRIRELAVKWRERGVPFYLINANPQDNRKSVTRENNEFNYGAPIMLDPAQVVARSLGLTRTAEAVILEPGSWRILYRGAIDDRLGYGVDKQEPKAHFLDNAIEDVVAGRAIKEQPMPAKGCLISYSEQKDLTYVKHAAPILQNRCQYCHSVGGAFPPFFTDYDTIKGWSKMIRETVITDRMPPMSYDPHYGKFQNFVALEPEEKARLVAWIDAGLPRGEGKDPLQAAPKAKPASAKLPAKIWEVAMAKPEKIGATGTKEYLYLQLGEAAPYDMWMTAFHTHTTNPRQIHHESIMVVGKPISYYEAKVKNRRDAGEVDKNTDGDLPLYILDEMKELYKSGEDQHYVRKGVWAAGRPQPDFLPPGTAIFIPKGHYVILEQHYVGNGRDDEEQTRIEFFGYKEKPKGIKLLHSHGIYETDYVIPPDDKSFVVTSKARGFKRPIELRFLLSHMHVRGRSLKFQLVSEDMAEKTIISIPNFDFGWHTGAEFIPEKPIKVPLGSKLRLICEFDNSASNPNNPDNSKEVRFGQTFDRAEMCKMNFGFTYADE